jgi:hypothetical protein
MLLILDDRSGSHRSAIAFAALYVLSRMGTVVIILQQVNL